MGTTIKLSGGDLGNEEMLVYCNLAEASSPVKVNYCNDPGEERWEPTPYQAADLRHRTSRLIAIGKQLAADAVGMSAEDFDCDAEEVD